MHTIYKDTHEYQCAGSIAHAQMTAYSTQCLEAIYITSKHLHFNPPTPCGVGLEGLPSRLLHTNFNPPTPCGVGRGLPCLSPPSADFNPPTPCGVGHCRKWRKTWSTTFQSTHPVWGGTSSDDSQAVAQLQFQSTHPVWGGTVLRYFCYGQVPYFNPPTPCGVGRLRAESLRDQHDFNPPTPCGVGQL